MNCNDHALASAEAELQAARVVANQKSKALSCVYDAYKKAEASNAAYVASYKNTSFAAVAAERAEASNAAYNEALNAARQAYYAASDKVGEMQAKWNEIDLQIWRSKKQNKENEDE